jgi:transitional endoplasmic reticulum ATPase
LGAELFVVNGSSLFDKYVGNTEKNIRDLFKRVAEHVPALLLLDEADALAQKRGQNMQGYRDGFLNVLLGELNGALESPQFSVLVTTNRLDMLDPAFVKRLKTINFPMPRRAALKEIVRVHLGTVPLTDALTIDELTSRIVNLLSCPNAENSLVRIGYRDGKSRVIEAHELVAGREVKMLVKEAGKRALNRTISGESVPVTLRDFELAVENQFNIWRSSLNRNNIRDYIYDLPDDAQIASVEPIKQAVSVTYLYPEAADVR